MAKEKTSILKKFGIALLVIVLLACAVVDGFYFYIKFYAPTRLIENTYSLGLQTTTSGETKSFIEIKYYTNENNNGLETLDVKFNYLTDENQENFYSQGIQIVANRQADSINWGYFVDDKKQYITDSKGNWYDFNNQVTTYSYFGSYNIEEDSAALYNYESFSDYTDTQISTNPLNDKSSFKVQLGDKLFVMKFKGAEDSQHDEANLYASQYAGANFLGNKVYNNYYYYNNIYAFLYKLYKGLDSVANGTKKSLVFEFGDMFNYYEYDEGNHRFNDTAIADSTKVIADMKSYYSIYVEKIADGVRKATDSLFNAVHGSTTYNSTPTDEPDDYFIGRAVVKVNVFSFDIEDVEGVCVLKLSKDFIYNYEMQKGKIVLSICINQDILEQLGYESFVISNNADLKSFSVYECYSTKTVNGEIVRAEVIL